DGRWLMADGSVREKTMFNAAVRIGAAVAPERPVATHLFDPGQVDLRPHERLVLGGLGHNDAERIAHEGVAPELDPGTLAIELLQADAVNGGHAQPVWTP